MRTPQFDLTKRLYEMTAKLLARCSLCKLSEIRERSEQDPGSVSSKVVYIMKSYDKRFASVIIAKWSENVLFTRRPLI